MKTSFSARQVLDTVAAVSMITASVLLSWALLRGPSAPGAQAAPAEPVPPREPISIAGDTRIGKADAKVVIVEYSDFECRYCRQVALEILPEIRQAFVDPGSAQLAFRHLPIERIHPLAFRAAEAAECAGAQGHFWTVHDAFFRSPELSESLVMSGGGLTALDRVAYADCLQQNHKAEKVRVDMAEARRLGITATPTFLLGTLEGPETVRVRRVIPGANRQALVRALTEISTTVQEQTQNKRRSR